MAEYTGTATTVAINTLSLTDKTQYEFYVVTYQGSTESAPTTEIEFVSASSETLAEAQTPVATYVTTVPDAPNAPGFSK